MKALPLGRSFEYDAKSLLGIVDPPPAPAGGEVELVISGMTGSNWNGMGDGTHQLDGIEILTGSYHSWKYFDVTTSNWMWMKAYQMSPTSSVLEYHFYYNGVGFGTASPSSVIHAVTAPSIRTTCFNSAIIQGVTFTWSKGANWSRGNM